MHGHTLIPAQAPGQIIAPAAHGSEQVACALAGSWRTDPPRPDVTEADLAQLMPRLTGSGAAALGWRILRSVPGVAQSAEAKPLHDAARLLAISDTLRQRAIAHLVGELNRVGVVPLLFKGWAAARHYAESYLRPYGDFDVLVRAEDYSATRAALARMSFPQAPGTDPNEFRIGVREAGANYTVDLHDALPFCYATPIEELFARAQRMLLQGGGTLLVPCPEDHLRIVILHFVRHGGWRPLWLCDIAAMSESAGAAFDWKLCRTSNPVARGWIDAAIGAAALLLGARVQGAEIGRPPAWFTATLLQEWDAPYAERAMPASGSEFRAPLAALRAKWPNPIRAAFLRGVPVPSARPVWQQFAYLFSEEIPRILSRLFGTRWWRQFLSHIVSKQGSGEAARRRLAKGQGV